MKKTAVFMSLILVLNLILFTPVSAQQIIAEPTVVSGYGHVLGLNRYGRVFAAGDNTYGQSLVFNWSDVVGIAAGKYFSAGLRRDGTVVVAGKYQSGSDYLEFDASELEEIVQISAGDNFLAALSEDGEVFVLGNDNEGKINTENWSHIKKIACGIGHVVGIKKEDGTCVGAGEGSKTELDKFNNITDIYAGADLTVLKDADGKFFYAGDPVSVNGDKKFEDYWNERDWNNIKDIIIFPDSRDSGIVIAIKNDGSIVVDNNEFVKEENFGDGESKIKLKTIAIKREATSNLYAICLSADNDASVIGKFSAEPEEHSKFIDQISQFDLEMEPLEKVYIKEPQVVVAYNTVAFVLPDGKVKSIGKKDLSLFAGIKQLSADMGFGENDVFIGVDNEGNTVSSIENDAWLDDWMGVLKVAPTVCSQSQKIAAALRWDKRMICYYKKSSLEPEKEYIIKKDNVVDVTCGNFYIAYLTENGDVDVEVIEENSKRYPFQKMEGIERLYGGLNHIVGLKNDGTCVAAGGSTTGNAAECEIGNWTNIKDVVAGDRFTVGLKSDGTCEFTGYEKTDRLKLRDAILKTSGDDTEYWENVAQLYGSANTVVAYKNDGFFEYATWSSEDLSQIENTYYKDNTFYTFKVEKNVATVEYYSDEDLDVYFSYFDEEGRPVGFEKKVLEPVPTLIKEVFKNEKSHSFSVSVGKPTADKMKFYMEHKAEGDTVKISHCALEGQRIMLAFYDNDKNMLDIKVRTLKESNSMIPTPFTAMDATKYKLFICNGGLPLYLGEGDLN